jgi:hypothetical protein
MEGVEKIINRAKPSKQCQFSSWMAFSPSKDHGYYANRARYKNEINR